MYFLSFAPTFIILTVSYETLFYVTFFFTLTSWTELEQAVDSFRSEGNGPDHDQSATHLDHRTVPNLICHDSKNSRSSLNMMNSATSLPDTHTSALSHRPLSLAHSRTALFFFILLQSAFFSTGNIASISSFSLESVSRLIPVFDPFSQGALLIFKILIPFTLLSTNLGLLNQSLRVAPSALFMIAMAISDILTLYFFWVVKDEGSWLDIGSSISHFAIASLMCVFVAALEGVSVMLVTEIEYQDG